MASDKIDKKRKRASDRHGRPSKKAAVELQDLPPFASKLVEENSELAPVIGKEKKKKKKKVGRQELTIKTTATTPGVNIPRDIHLTPYLKKRDHALDAGRASRNQGIVASEILLQSSEHPKLDFVGREAEDEVDSQLKHYIAVVNPESKAWELVEARKVTLRGSVRNLKSLGEDEEEGEDGEEDEAMVSDNFLNLLLLFFFFFLVESC